MKKNKKEEEEVGHNNNTNNNVVEIVLPFLCAGIGELSCGKINFLMVLFWLPEFTILTITTSSTISRLTLWSPSQSLDRCKVVWLWWSYENWHFLVDNSLQLFRHGVCRAAAVFGSTLACFPRHSWAVHPGTSLTRAQGELGDDSGVQAGHVSQFR